MNNSKFVDFLTGLIEGAKNLLADSPIKRRIKDVDSWDGSPSRWETTEDYCNDCLINLNEGDPEDWTQASCKLPIREPGDGSDTFVRQAVFAAAGGRGISQVDAPEEAKREAANEIIRAYDEMDETAPDSVYEIAGREPPEERAMSFYQIQDQVWDLTYDLGYLIDVYTEEGAMYALLADEGRLLRQPLSIVDNQVVLAGEPFMVTVEHPAIQTRTTIDRQKDGSYRWFSISATSVLNRVGEIDSQALFRSFVDYVKETGEYPIRQFYHQGSKFRTGKADFIAHDENCLITSGLFDDTELADMEVKAREKSPDYWGESIGYFPVSEPEMYEVQKGINIPVYTAGILREISTLPENQAANLFTVTIQRNKEVNMLTGKVMEAFVRLFDGNQEAAEQWLTENVDELNRGIKKSGMITRDNEPEEDPQPAMVERVNQLQDTINQINSALETVNANQGDIVERLNGLQEIEARLLELEKSKTEQLQVALADMPTVPTVRRYEYQPRQGKKENGAQSGSMSDRAKQITNFY